MRRELCFGFFKRIFIAEEGVSGADLHTLYAEILIPEIGEQIKREREAVTAGEFGDLVRGQSEGRAIQENGPRAPWPGNQRTLSNGDRVPT